jgi:chromosome segregation ATPase
MAAEYTKLQEQIAGLQCEIVPLRARIVELRHALLGYQCQPSTLDFSSTMIHFQTEENSLDRQLRAIRFLHSAKSIHELEGELDTGEAACRRFPLSLDRIDREMQNLIADIETYKLSQIYEEVQRQKRKIIKLSMELDQKIHVHDNLTAKRFALAPDNTRSADDASAIERLNYKVVTARRRHAETCERLLVIRNAQIREIEEVTAAIAIAPPPKEDLPALPPTASIVLLRQALAGITGLESSDSPWTYQWDA